MNKTHGKRFEACFCISRDFSGFFPAPSGIGLLPVGVNSALEEVQRGVSEPLRGENFDVRGALEDVALDVESGARSGGHDCSFLCVPEDDLAFGPLFLFLVRGLGWGDQEFDLVGLGLAGDAEGV